MGTWGQLLQEISKVAREQQKAGVVSGTSQPSPYDIVRRKYLNALHQHTKRATIIYATPWLESIAFPVQAQQLSINLGDTQGFMEAVSNINERELDLVITSPGGSAEAAESIMSYLRTRFDHIRAVIPVAAMSAATMMALACDEIVMGTHSQLGPIDPQFTIQTPEGPRQAPGQAILDQFELAKTECQDPRNIGAWLPMLRALLPGLLAQCAHQRALAEEFAEQQLAAHMFKGETDGPARAKAAAGWFADFTAFRSHGRRVGPAEAKAQGLKVIDLEADQVLQDLVLSVHHAVRHTFGNTGTTKLIENHTGRCYIEMVLPTQILMPGSGGPPVPQGPGAGPKVPFQLPQPAPTGNRAERRGKR